MKRSLFVIVGLCLGVGAVVSTEQRRVPLATEADKLLARLEIARDGSYVIVRDIAPDDMRLCVNPGRYKAEQVCFTVGDVRRGKVKVR